MGSEDRRSLFKMSGLPESFGVILLTVALVLFLSPYLAGTNIGNLDIPKLSQGTANAMEVFAPIILVVLIFTFLPIWKRREKRIEQTDEERDPRSADSSGLPVKNHRSNESKEQIDPLLGLLVDFETKSNSESVFKSSASHGNKSSLPDTTRIWEDAIWYVFDENDSLVGGIESIRRVAVEVTDTWNKKVGIRSLDLERDLIRLEALKTKAKLSEKEAKELMDLKDSVPRTQHSIEVWRRALELAFLPSSQEGYNFLLRFPYSMDQATQTLSMLTNYSKAEGEKLAFVFFRTSSKRVFGALIHLSGEEYEQSVNEWTLALENYERLAPQKEVPHDWKFLIPVWSIPLNLVAKNVLPTIIYQISKKIDSVQIDKNTNLEKDIAKALEAGDDENPIDYRSWTLFVDSYWTESYSKGSVSYSDLLDIIKSFSLPPRSRGLWWNWRID